MKNKDLIKKLLDYPMDCEVVIENIPTANARYIDLKFAEVKSFSDDFKIALISTDDFELKVPKHISLMQDLYLKIGFDKDGLKMRTLLDEIVKVLQDYMGYKEFLNWCKDNKQ